MTRHTVRFNRAVEIYVYNDTKSPHKIYGDAVVLTSGVYEVYYGGQLVARLRLMSHTPNTTINLPNTTAGAAPTVTTLTVTQTVTRTVTTTTTQTITLTTTLIRTLRETTTVTKTATTTVTNVVVVEKPYIHPITYVATAAAVAMAVLAAYLTRRRS